MNGAQVFTLPAPNGSALIRRSDQIGFNRLIRGITLCSHSYGCQLQRAISGSLLRTRGWTWEARLEKNIEALGWDTNNRQKCRSIVPFLILWMNYICQILTFYVTFMIFFKSHNCWNLNFYFRILAYYLIIMTFGVSWFLPFILSLQFFSHSYDLTMENVFSIKLSFHHILLFTKELPYLSLWTSSKVSGGLRQHTCWRSTKLKRWWLLRPPLR